MSIFRIHSFERLNQFAHARLHHPDNRTLNLFNLSLSKWDRYYEYLQIIYERYEQANALFVEAIQRRLRNQAESKPTGSRAMTTQECQEFQESVDLGKKLHLEIESFYLFANILLDRVASTCRYYYWKKPNWNHMQVVRNLATICTKRSLSVTPPDLLTLPEELQKLIVEYRNKYVEHLEEPRIIFATSWGPEQRAKIQPTFLYPEPEEIGLLQKPSDDLMALLSRLALYMTAMLDFFDANSGKSILPPPFPPGTNAK
jgi:hypothetical protein